jgi:uncharacterized protein
VRDNTLGWWSIDHGCVTLSVRVTPGARRSELGDVAGDRLRVRVAAPAIDGKANAELRRYMASLFGVRASAVSLAAGEHARDKVIRVHGVTELPAALRR